MDTLGDSLPGTPESMYSIFSPHFSLISSLVLCSFSNFSCLSLPLACADSTSLIKELAALSACCTVVLLFFCRYRNVIIH